MNIMKLSQTNIDKVTDFCTGKISTLGDDLYTNLVLSYLDDSNSSTMREAVTANICKYKWLNEKLGWDAVDETTNEFKEIKPKRHSKGRFDGGGNFSDLTPKRIAQFKGEDSGVVSSFFVDGRLCYVIEFKLSDILDHLEEQVRKKCIVEGNRYARSTGYNFRHWINSNNLKIHYINIELIKEKNCFHKEFQKLLEQKINDRELLECSV